MRRDSALIGVALAAQIGRNMSLFASYDGDIGGGHNNQLWGGLKISL